MPAGESPFVSLADALRARRPTAAAAAIPVSATPGGIPLCARPAASVAIDPPPVAAPPAAAPPDPAEQHAAIREARLFSAALGEAFDLLRCDLVRELAVEVLGRELQLAEADLAGLAVRLIAERLAQEPLRLRVAAADSGVACELPLFVDPLLAPGDAILECRSGSIDARLHVRLAAVLATVAP